MGKKIKKRDIDEQLLAAFFSVEDEWKRIRSIVNQSIEPTMDGKNSEAIARAKYIFLLKEARHRNISAIQK